MNKAPLLVTMAAMLVLGTSVASAQGIKTHGHVWIGSTAEQKRALQDPRGPDGSRRRNQARPTAASMSAAQGSEPGRECPEAFNRTAHQDRWHFPRAQDRACQARYAGASRRPDPSRRKAVSGSAGRC